MTTVTVPAPASGLSATAAALRRLYFVRFGFAIVWALVMFTTPKHIGPLAATLLVLYPLFDAAAAVVDARTSRVTGSSSGSKTGSKTGSNTGSNTGSGAASPKLLYANIAISLLTAAAVAVADASGIPAVLRVWGIWAIVAGLIQLIVGVTRRAMGGQWPMIVSGGISVLAGGSFVATASAHSPALTNAIGYAIPGAVFFLISAIRLGRTAATKEA